MKLLIVTQKVDINDDVLGFFHGWISEFAKKFEKVTVICLKQGNHNLPPNVKVLSLGKEKGRTRLNYLFNFYKYIWEERQNYDAVFVHMNPRYAVLGWPVWKILGKKISLWYAAAGIPPMLHLANGLVDIVFTSTPEGYRLKSEKIIVVGQGIDTDLFRPTTNNQRLTTSERPLKIISVGRISPSKDYETLIKAVKLLANNNFYVEIAGQPATRTDKEYLSELKTKIQENELAGKIALVGPIANRELPKFLQSADMFVNMSHTGSLDKAILEAMSCGLPILTCNEALTGVLGPQYGNMLMYPKKDAEQLAQKIEYIFSLTADEREDLALNLRNIVAKDHKLDILIDKISKILLSNDRKP